MLNYYILILEKVSFNVGLFGKELKKAIRVLLPIEITILENWFVGFVKDKINLQFFKKHFIIQ